jgi:hypothetical protein
VAGPRVHTPSLERVDRICVAESDAKSLRIRVLDEVRRVVAFDSYVWLLTDPSTAVGCAPLADVPCLGELPTLIKLKYLTEVNRWTELVADGCAARSLRTRTDGDLSRSLVWREVMCRYGVRDVASAVFADGYGCWGFLDLWRGPAPGCFGQDDIDYLSRLAPRLTEALRRCQAMTFGRAPVSQRRDAGPAVLLLDDGLDVVGQTALARQRRRRRGCASWCRRCRASPRSRPPSTTSPASSSRRSRVSTPVLPVPGCISRAASG